MVIYFSGTGNSTLAAELLAKELNDEIVNSFKFIRGKKGGSFTSQKPFVFVCPAYAWRVPVVFKKFIEASQFKGSKEAYFAMTCGDDIGNAGKYNRKTAEHKGLIYKGSLEVIMPENYITKYEAPPMEEALKIIKKGMLTVKEGARYIKEGKNLPEKNIVFSDIWKSTYKNYRFYPIYVKAGPFFAKDNCIGCGRCEAVCPLGNIKLTDKKPVWGKECTQCQACICSCPVEAIEYGNKSQGKERYICPTLFDMEKL